MATHFRSVDPPPRHRPGAERRGASARVWLVAAASGPEAYEGVQDFLGSWIGLLLLFGWTLSMFYHLCNGIRHLVWDTGHALDLESTYLGGWIVVGATAS